MRYFLVLALILSFYSSAFTQATFTTIKSGNYTDAATWSGGIKPLTSSPDCDCTIEIASSHQLTLNTTVSLTNARIVLKGPNSSLIFSNNVKLTLSGTSSIDIQTNNSFIYSDKANNTITLSNTIIFTGKQTAVNTTENGRVLGEASASSLRQSPTFQNFTLPVQLAEFGVKREKTSVILSWRTDLEINSDFFEVQRSGDGKSWVRLGSVKAAGNVGVSQNYSFIDYSPLNGHNYYRLKIVDIDSKFEYSPIKLSDILSNTVNIGVSPNPASNVLNISISSGSQKDFQLSLVNRIGQIVFTRKYIGSTTRISIPVSGYVEGSYYIRLSREGANDEVKSVIVARHN